MTRTTNFLDGLLEDDCMKIADPALERRRPDRGGYRGRGGGNYRGRGGGGMGQHDGSGGPGGPGGGYRHDRGGMRGGGGGNHFSKRDNNTGDSGDRGDVESPMGQRNNPTGGRPFYSNDTNTPDDNNNRSKGGSYRNNNRGGASGSGVNNIVPMTRTNRGEGGGSRTINNRSGGGSIIQGLHNSNTSNLSSPNNIKSNQDGSSGANQSSQTQPQVREKPASIPFTEEEKLMMVRRSKVNKLQNTTTTVNDTNITEKSANSVSAGTSESSALNTPVTPTNNPSVMPGAAAGGLGNPSAPSSGGAAVIGGGDEPMKRIKGRSAFRANRAPDNPEDALKRDMINNLNKLTVENFARICAVISNIVSGITKKTHLSSTIRMILDKTVSESVSSEVYVDLIHVLSTTAPEFDTDGNAIPAATGNDASKKTFKELVSFHCSELGELVPKVLELNPATINELSEEEKNEGLMKMRNNVIGTVKMITSMMIRTVVKPSFWKRLMSRLTFTEDELTAPPDHLVEACCESIKVCGLFLDTVEKENDRLKVSGGDTNAETIEYKHFKTACLHLKQMIWKFQVLVETDVSARVSCTIFDVLDARDHQWFYKTHREKAKTIADIREDHRRSNIVGGAHVAAQYGRVEQMGIRANLLNPEYKEYYLSKTHIPGFTTFCEGNQTL